jgi:hypothetical protein
MVPISVQNHRQGVEDLRNAHFLPVAGSRSWETPDCAFELVDDRDELVCGEVDCSPARAADLIVLPKPRHGFLYLRAALRTHDWQHTVFENARHSYLPMSATLRQVVAQPHNRWRSCLYPCDIFTLWEEYHKWHSQRSIRRVSITTRRPLTNRVQFRLRRHTTNEIWVFARSKAQAMHPEIACNNNYDNHYANDIKDVHCVCSRYEMVVRGVTTCSHAQRIHIT